MTDIAITSTAKSYGFSDMGAAGIQNFKNKHVCNGVCRALDLQPLSKTTVSHALGGVSNYYTGGAPALRSNSARLHASGFGAVIEADEDEYDSE